MAYNVAKHKPARRAPPRLLSLLLLLTGLVTVSGCSEEDRTVFNLVEFDGRDLPQDPADGCCEWKSGTLTLGVSTYRLAFVLHNKTGVLVGGHNVEVARPDADQLSNTEEEGTFTSNGPAIEFDRTFSSFPVAILTDIRLDGEEISAILEVDLHPSTTNFSTFEQPGVVKRYEVLFRR